MRSSLAVPSIPPPRDSGDYGEDSPRSTKREALKPMEHETSSIGAKNIVSATFQVPGLITIPSDNAVHIVPIAQLSLDVSMSWVAVPKADTKANLRVRFPSSSLFLVCNAKHFTGEYHKYI